MWVRRCNCKKSAKFLQTVNFSAAREQGREHETRGQRQNQRLESWSSRNFPRGITTQKRLQLALHCHLRLSIRQSLSALIMRPAPLTHSAPVPHQISTQSVSALLSYSDLTIYNSSAVHHLGFDLSEFQPFRSLRWPSMHPHTHIHIKFQQTVTMCGWVFFMI